MFRDVDEKCSVPRSPVADGALLIVNGESMHPLISCGEWVKVRTDRTVSAGECCVFRFGRSLLLHRLIMRKNGWCWLWGDNAGTIEHVPAGDIVAFVSDGRSMLFHAGMVFVSSFALLLRRKDGTIPYRVYIARKKIVKILADSDRIFKKVKDTMFGLAVR